MKNQYFKILFLLFSNFPSDGKAFDYIKSCPKIEERVEKLLNESQNSHCEQNSEKETELFKNQYFYGALIDDVNKDIQKVRKSNELLTNLSRKTYINIFDKIQKDYENSFDQTERLINSVNPKTIQNVVLLKKEYEKICKKLNVATKGLQYEFFKNGEVYDVSSSGIKRKLHKNQILKIPKEIWYDYKNQKKSKSNSQTSWSYVLEKTTDPDIAKKLIQQLQLSFLQNKDVQKLETIYRLNSKNATIDPNQLSILFPSVQSCLNWSPTSTADEASYTHFFDKKSKIEIEATEKGTDWDSVLKAKKKFLSAIQNRKSELLDLKQALHKNNIPDYFVARKFENFLVDSSELAPEVFSRVLEHNNLRFQYSVCSALSNAENRDIVKKWTMLGGSIISVALSGFTLGATSPAAGVCVAAAATSSVMASASLVLSAHDVLKNVSDYHKMQSNYLLKMINNQAFQKHSDQLMLSAMMNSAGLILNTHSLLINSSHLYEIGKEASSDLLISKLKGWEEVVQKIPGLNESPKLEYVFKNIKNGFEFMTEISRGITNPAATFGITEYIDETLSAVFSKVLTKNEVTEKVVEEILLSRTNGFIAKQSKLLITGKSNFLSKEEIVEASQKIEKMVLTFVKDFQKDKNNREAYRVLGQ